MACSGRAALPPKHANATLARSGRAALVSDVRTDRTIHLETSSGHQQLVTGATPPAAAPAKGACAPAAAQPAAPAPAAPAPAQAAGPAKKKTTRVQVALANRHQLHAHAAAEPLYHRNMQNQCWHAAVGPLYPRNMQNQCWRAAAGPLYPRSTQKQRWHATAGTLHTTKTKSLLVTLRSNKLKHR